MPTINSRDLEAKLLLKGFRHERTTNHKFYVFIHEEIKTRAWTKISIGPAYDLRNTLITTTCKQMMLSRPDLYRFVDCSLSKEDYTNLLIKQGVIRQCS